jgi:hypothetical protein
MIVNTYFLPQRIHAIRAKVFTIMVGGPAPGQVVRVVCAAGKRRDTVLAHQRIADVSALIASPSRCRAWSSAPNPNYPRLRLARPSPPAEEERVEAAAEQARL